MLLFKTNYIYDSHLPAFLCFTYFLQIVFLFLTNAHLALAYL